MRSKNLSNFLLGTFFYLLAASVFSMENSALLEEDAEQHIEIARLYQYYKDFINAEKCLKEAQIKYEKCGLHEKALACCHMISECESARMAEDITQAFLKNAEESFTKKHYIKALEWHKFAKIYFANANIGTFDFKKSENFEVFIKGYNEAEDYVNAAEGFWHRGKIAEGKEYIERIEQENPENRLLAFRCLLRLRQYKEALARIPGDYEQKTPALIKAYVEDRKDFEGALQCYLMIGNKEYIYNLLSFLSKQDTKKRAFLCEGDYIYLILKLSISSQEITEAQKRSERWLLTLIFNENAEKAAFLCVRLGFPLPDIASKILDKYKKHSDSEIWQEACLKRDSGENILAVFLFSRLGSFDNVAKCLDLIENHNVAFRMYLHYKNYRELVKRLEEIIAMAELNTGSREENIKFLSRFKVELYKYIKHKYDAISKSLDKFESMNFAVLFEHLAHIESDAGDIEKSLYFLNLASSIYFKYENLDEKCHAKRLRIQQLIAQHLYWRYVANSATGRANNDDLLQAYVLFHHCNDTNGMTNCSDVLMSLNNLSEEQFNKLLAPYFEIDSIMNSRFCS